MHVSILEVKSQSAAIHFCFLRSPPFLFFVTLPYSGLFSRNAQAKQFEVKMTTPLQQRGFNTGSKPLFEALNFRESGSILENVVPQK